MSRLDRRYDIAELIDLWRLVASISLLRRFSAGQFLSANSAFELSRVR